MDAKKQRLAGNGVMRKLLKVSRLHKAAFEKHVELTGVHQSQHRLLMHLSNKAFVPSQKWLAEHLEISPAAVAVSLKKLEKAGYIERDTADGDSRTKEIRLSEAGTEVVTQSKDYFHSFDEHTFSALTDEELEVFASCLEKIVMTLKSSTAEASEGKDKEQKQGEEGEGGKRV